MDKILSTILSAVLADAHSITFIYIKCKQIHVVKSLLIKRKCSTQYAKQKRKVILVGSPFSRQY